PCLRGCHAHLVREHTTKTRHTSHTDIWPLAITHGITCRRHWRPAAQASVQPLPTRARHQCGSGNPADRQIKKRGIFAMSWLSWGTTLVGGVTAFFYLGVPLLVRGSQWLPAQYRFQPLPFDDYIG